jgi:putative cardiolipin synthase
MFLRTLSLLLVSTMSFQALAAPAGDSSTVPGDSKALLENFVYRTQEPQEMSIYNQGNLSLQKRLEMIASAKHSIEVEFFIYNIDQVGRLITQALVKKAREGVQVRVLVDFGWPNPKLDIYYANLLIKNGVQVRYFNPAFTLNVLKGQFRSHRKSLIVDDQEGITGGRNIADEYFDLSPEFNFLDRDVHIRGSLAKAMRVSFDRFWNTKMTQVPEKIREPKLGAYGIGTTDEGDGKKASTPRSRYENALKTYQEGVKNAEAYLLESDRDREILTGLSAMKLLRTNTVNMHICNDSVFAADIPGIGPTKRYLFEEIRSQLKQAKKSIDIETPYFVSSASGLVILSNYLSRGIEINLITNSLKSTDSVSVSAAFYPRGTLLLNQGMKLSVYGGNALPSQDFVVPEITKAKWGIHAKSAVIDKRTMMIGTFNTDPRSRNINAEMAVICMNNPEIAAEVLQSMDEHREQSVKLNRLGAPADGTSIFEGTSLSRRALFYLTLPFSNVLSFLL